MGFGVVFFVEGYRSKLCKETYVFVWLLLVTTEMSVELIRIKGTLKEYTALEAKHLSKLVWKGSQRSLSCLLKVWRAPRNFKRMRKAEVDVILLPPNDATLEKCNVLLIR